MRIGPIVCELEGPGPTLYISSTTVITGPLDSFTMARSGDMVLESSLGLPVPGFAAASFAACAARASGVQIVPVIAAAAPITAWRIRNARRSIFSGRFDSAANSGNTLSLSDDGLLIVVPVWLESSARLGSI